MWFTINGPTADTEHDQLIVTGTSNVSAQGLWVSLGYTPPVGAFFDIIMSAGGVTGPFSWSYLPSLGAGKAWEIQYLADRIRLLVIDPNAPPEPECTTYLFNLNNSLADETNTVSLTSNGGTLGATNYSFGPNQGPSLSNVLGDTYTIEMRFTLDDVSGYSKLIDFKNLTSDNGLYFLSMWTK